MRGTSSGIRHAALFPLPLALTVATASGLVLDGAFPDRNLWWLAMPAVALILASLIGRSAGASLLVGLAAGLAFYITHIEWASLFLGPLPMGALVTLEAVYFAGGALLVTFAYRWIPRLWTSVTGRLIGLPAVVAGLWSLRESVAANWPYGGFSWGRLGMSQVDGPLASLFGWVGLSGVSYLMVLIAAMFLEVFRERDVELGRRMLPGIIAATLVVGLPFWPISQTGTMRVAAVQGAGPAGYFDRREAGDLLAAQYKATLPLFGEEADVVLWPEGSTDLSPLVDPNTAAVLDNVASSFDAPFVTWAVTERGGQTFNTELLWEEGVGATDFYDKKRPVPFGEYIPDRTFWRPFAPDLIDLVQRDYTPGTTDSIFTIDGVPVAISICFDIVDDQALRTAIAGGAQVVFASSNNADFGRTDQSEQQLAIARVRALELGRSIVNISTVGRSAVIAFDGSIVRSLPKYEPAALVEDVALSDTVTPAALLGRQLEVLVAATSLCALVLAAGTHLSRRYSRKGSR